MDSMHGVVETPGYLKDAESIFTVQQRETIVIMVANDPECGEIMQGPGGVASRKESMSEKAFSKIMRGLQEAKAYIEGEREGYKVTVPASVDVKSIRKGLNMTQAAFSNSFGFSLDAVKHWEGGRRTPEVPARAYLTVIQRNPSAVLEALHPASAITDRTEAAVRRRPKSDFESAGLMNDLENVVKN